MAEPSSKLQLDLSGGMNVYSTPLVIKDNEAELIVNYELTRAGGIQKRKGYTTVGNQIVSNNAILAIAEGTNSNYRRIAAIDAADDATSTLYRLVGSTWTVWKTGDLAGAVPRFESFVGYIFRANGSDDLQSASGTSWGYTNCPVNGDNFNPRYIKRFGDRLYGADASNHGGTSRIFWSSLPSASLVLTWDLTNDYADIDPDTGEAITGLDVNGDRLLIFKNNAIFRWQFGATDADRIIGVGAFSQDVIRTNYELGITFFVSKRGIYSYSPFSEGRPRLISRPIQRWFDAVPNLSTARMEIDLDNVYVFTTGNTTLGGTTISRAVFVYNIPLDAWTLYSMPSAQVNAVGQFQEIGASTGAVSKIMIGDFTGRVYQFGSGTSDNTSPIATEFISKEYLLHFPEQVQLREINMFALTQGSTQSFFDTDRSGTFEGIGQMNGRISSKRVTNKKCNSIRMRFTDNSIGDALIEGFEFEYDVLPYKEEKARNIRTK